MIVTNAPRSLELLIVAVISTCLGGCAIPEKLMSSIGKTEPVASEAPASVSAEDSPTRTQEPPARVSRSMPFFYTYRSNITPPTRKQYLEAQLDFLNEKNKNVDYQLIEKDSVFSLIHEIENGRIRESDLENKLLFFQNTLGQGGLTGTEFECIQTYEISSSKDSEGEIVKQYGALYVNSRVNINVEVLWWGNRPLVGQKLNADALLFTGFDQYKNKNGDERSAVVLSAPRWAGSNGYVPEDFSEREIKKQKFLSKLRYAAENCRKVREDSDVPMSCTIQNEDEQYFMVLTVPDAEYYYDVMSRADEGLVKPYCESFSEDWSESSSEDWSESALVAWQNASQDELKLHNCMTGEISPWL